MKYEALNSSFLKCLFSIEYWKYFFNLTWDLWAGWEGWILKFSCGSAGISEIWELKSCVADSQTQASFFNCLVLSCSLPIKEFDMEKRQRLVAPDSQRWGLEMDRLGCRIKRFHQKSINDMSMSLAFKANYYILLDTCL